MKTKYLAKDDSSIAASVAPEDLQCGSYIAVLNEVVEYPSFLWSDSVLGERDELIRVRCIPTGSGTPLKVKAICLPFVYVKSPAGQGEMIDVRRAQLVRLDERYAKEVWKDLRLQEARRRLEGQDK